METRGNRKRKVLPTNRVSDQPECSARKKEDKKPPPLTPVPLPGVATPAGRRSQKRLRRSTGTSRKRSTRFPKSPQEEHADTKKTKMESKNPSENPSDDELGLNDEQRKNMQSASTALHGLLRRLGAGWESILPEQTASNSELKDILSCLRNAADESTQLNALSELCGILSMGTEDTLAGFSIEGFVPALVKCLNVEHNPDMMLLAARAIAHLADAMPMSSTAMVHYGAVNALCERLLNIEYIDLAEQSLYALEKISKEAPTSCVRTGALMAVLSYLDFFPLGIQRVALSAAANMCRQLPTDCWQYVKGAIPIMTNLLRYHDTKIVDHACTCLCRIAEQISLKGITSLDELCKLGVVEEAANLVCSAMNSTGEESSGTSISPHTFVGLIKLMSVCVVMSSSMAVRLHQLDISKTLSLILGSSSLLSGTPKSPSTVLKSSGEVVDVLTLAENLLPPLPEASLTSFHLSPTKLLTPNEGKKEGGQEELQTFLNADMNCLYVYGCNLVQTLLQLHTSTMNNTVRHKCLVILCKIVYFCSPDQLQELMRDIPFSSFLASLLSTGDSMSCQYSLMMCDILMEKRADLFGRAFLREGVVHAIDVLAATPVQDEAEKEVKPSHGRRWAFVASPRTPGGPGAVPRAVIARSAAQFKAARFPLLSEADGGDAKLYGLEGLAQLRQISSGLAQASDKKDYDLAFKSLTELNALLSGKSEHGMFSRFELASSGLVQTLKQFLLKDSGCQLDIRALKVTADVLLSAETCSMKDFIGHLNEVLSSTERFRCLLLAQNERPGRILTDSGALSVLAHPLKLRLVRHSAENQFKDYGDNVVLIEPLATMSAIEEFLWPRISSDGEETSSKLNATERKESSHAQYEPRQTRRSSEEALREAERKGKGPVVDGDKSLNVETSTQKPPIHGQSANLKLKDVQMQAKDDAEEVTDDNEEEDDLDECAEEDMMDDEDLISEEEDYIADMEELADDIEDGEDDHELETLNEVHDVDLEEKKAGDAQHSLSLRQSPRRAGKSNTGTAVTREPVVEKKEGGGSSTGRPKLVFEMNGVVIDPTSTIFRAIRQSSKLSDEEEVSAVEVEPPGVWDTVYTLVYRGEGAAELQSTTEILHTPPVSNSKEIGDLLEGFESLHISSDPSVNDVVDLLRILEYLSRSTPYLLEDAECYGTISPETFVNSKLTSKLKRQLQDALLVCSGGLPRWCELLVKQCPFIFSFESRQQYFYRTCLGLGRALQHLQQQHDLEGRLSHRNVNANDFRVGRLQRQKVRISRKRILDSAAKVFEMYAGQKAVLEVEYFGEVGTGLGPTLEFYTLVSQELQKKSLGLWRCEHGASSFGNHKSSEFVSAPHGLFPNPLPPNLREKKEGKLVLSRFKLCGRLVGKALQDNRLLDLPISPVFYSLLLNRHVGIADVCRMDPTLGKQLVGIKTALAQHKRGTPLVIFGTRLEDLQLEFSVPGYPEYRITSEDNSEEVTEKNVDEWLEAVLDATLGAGVSHQVEAFRAGFSEVLDSSRLNIFSEDEIECLLCGSVEEWKPDYLLECIKFDHGYSPSSTPVKHLLEVLCSLTEEDRRRFLRFVTGSPRLPAGGLSALQPRLTVVRKHSADDASAKDLPSVMTCANYLKLPAYEDVDVLRERLMYALHEGQGSFDLS